MDILLNYIEARPKSTPPNLLLEKYDGIVSNIPMDIKTLNEEPVIIEKFLQLPN